MIPSKPRLLATLSLACLPLLAFSQSIPPPEEKPDAKKRVVGYVHRPAELAPPKLESIKVPKGFIIEHFARDLGNARILAIGPNGNVYVTRREQGDVLMLKIGANGLAEGAPKRVAGRPGVHGITFHQNTVYLASPREVYRGEVKPDGSFANLELIIADLPDAGQHNTRMLAVGPDNMLYIGVASATNEAHEPNQEAATILRSSLDGKSRSIFASGLRDPIGWGWHPKTGELWEMDHGIDWLGDDEQPEELNHIQKGKRYGWPFIYAEGKENVQRTPPGGLTREEWKKVSTPMVMGYTAHAAPMQLSFYTGTQFPEDYRHDAFVSMRGSWNREKPSGYEVVRIRFKDGRPHEIEPFITGFVSSEGEHGRLCGNVIAPDGSLLFTDDRNGIIYRVRHTNATTASAAATEKTVIPADSLKRQNKEGVKERLAHEVVSAKGKQPLNLRTSAFADGGQIPIHHSAYDQNVSVPLEWNKGPEGMKSYALLMEDPDASVTPLPVVHWVVWNIPADVLSLREGIPPNERTRDPDGMRQGATYSGKAGYQGPRPPEGEPAHRYYFQLFALDKELDLPLGASRAEFLEAAKDHVLATAVLHGKFARPDKPKKP